MISMPNFDIILTILWLLFIAYWLFSALGAKRNLQKNMWARGLGIRLLLVVVIIIFLRLQASEHLFRYDVLFVSNALAGSIGLVLCVLGFGLAVWARVHLGRNWGMPMSLKENPELVTTGPYTYVRHPIYSGFLLAILGSAFVVGFAWLISLVIFCAYFVYSAKTEEKIMTKQFPDQYPEYKKRTKMLIPFIV
jgi:protein-S-isoprenylcysteine O-methyltransferase Ste14